MKWINNALLCCVQRGRLDYELSGEQEAQQWGVRCTPPRFNTRQGRRKMLWCTYIKMSDKTARRSHKCVPLAHPPEAYTHTAYTRKENSSTRSRGEDTEAQTHTHARAAKGQGTHCHTHRLKCHTGESGRTAGRGELSSRGKICPCRCCLADPLKRARTHGDTQRKVMDPVTQQLERGRA